MTESVIDAQPDEAEDALEAVPLNCRHCGQPIDLDPAADPNAEVQCPACERYQDTIACPTCSQPTRISLLSAELVPAPHAPARRRRS